VLNDIPIDTLEVFGWPSEDIFVLVEELSKFLLFFGTELSPYHD
jgi:hypothetical protein